MHHSQQSPSAGVLDFKHDEVACRRRNFLTMAGCVAGGVALAANSHSLAAGFPEDCAPPTPARGAVPFKPQPGAPLRARMSAWNPNNAANIDNLKRAYAQMRKLSNSSPADPRGFIQQANVHCWYCGGGSDGMQAEEIHASWLFFAWHRCFLFFHERILAKLIAEPTLALTYWDWDNPERRTIPPPFVTPNDASNPLFDQLRGVQMGDSIPSEAFTNLDFALNSPLSDNKYFLGKNSANPDADNEGGHLENGVHGFVHLWVGDVNVDPSNPQQDMGILATAARDPVFFAHHANIDRLWDVWLKASSTHHNYTNAEWLTHKWTFYDENAVWTSITIADVLDHERSLAYVYTEPSDAPQAIATLHVARAAAAVEVRAEPVTKSVAVPDDVRALIATAAETVEVPARSYRLHIAGVRVPAGKGALVRVYVNKPDATAATSVEIPEYAGYFVVVPEHLQVRTANQEKPRPRAYSFDISDRIVQVATDRKELAVTLVPVTGRNQKPSQTELSYDRIYLTVEKNAR